MRVLQSVNREVVDCFAVALCSCTPHVSASIACSRLGIDSSSTAYESAVLNTRFLSTYLVVLLSDHRHLLYGKGIVKKRKWWG